MSDLDYTKEKLQRRKWWSRGRVLRSTGRCICFLVLMFHRTLCGLLWFSCLCSSLNIYIFCIVSTGESMCLPVLLRSTLTCLRISKRAATRWHRAFSNLKYLPKCVYQLKQQKCAMMCIMLMHKNPNLSLVLLSITLSPSSICRMINRGYILAQTKWLMKRKWQLILCPSLSLDC